VDNLDNVYVQNVFKNLKVKEFKRPFAEVMIKINCIVFRDT